MLLNYEGNIVEGRTKKKRKIRNCDVHCKISLTRNAEKRDTTKNTKRKFYVVNKKFCTSKPTRAKQERLNDK